MGEPEDDMANDENANILLVDDSPEKLLALETVLESLGQRLVRASSSAWVAAITASVGRPRRSSILASRASACTL